MLFHMQRWQTGVGGGGGGGGDGATRSNFERIDGDEGLNVLGGRDDILGTTSA